MYEGRFPDGRVFDSSYERGEPIDFPLNGVIAGFSEGIQLMTVGAKYTFTMPPDLAYGARGAGGVIPPNAVLVFDVELLAINGES
jgi:FKBP-type peptidyl-prolyl cis-trans isomerase